MGENVAYQLEGFLFPATYDLPENSKQKMLWQQCLKHLTVKSAMNGLIIAKKTV